FPCAECSLTFPNTVQLSRHMISGTCEGQLKAIAEAHAKQEQPLYEFDFFNDGRPRSSLDGSPWQSPGFEGGHHSAGGLGSLGVHFVRTKTDGDVLVLKQGDRSTATEYFCARVLEKLQVPCPKMRVLSRRAWAAAATAASQPFSPSPLHMIPYTVQGAGEVLAGARAQEAGGVMQSFAKGFTLKDPRVKDLLSHPSSAPSILRDLGAMAAADMLLNNFDRTPLIWDHEGNANNFMFVTDNHVAAIDNSTAGITNEDGIERYLGRVQAALQEALQHDAQGKHTAKVVHFIEKWTGLTLDADSIRAFHDGLVDTARRAAHDLDLTRCWEESFDAFSSADWGAFGVDLINVPFLTTVQQSFQAAV
ncbi:uncharacterized protein MONBRDRAFT_22989, partial [Monosiga brevicollis MX1]